MILSIANDAVHILRLGLMHKAVINGIHHVLTGEKKSGG